MNNWQILRRLQFLVIVIRQDLEKVEKNRNSNNEEFIRVGNNLNLKDAK